MYEKEQKEKICEMLNHFKDNKLDTNDKYSIKKLNDDISTILEREVENLGYEPTPEYDVQFYYDPNSDDLAYFQAYPPLSVKNNNAINVNIFTSPSLDKANVDNIPGFYINTATLYKDLASDSLYDRIRACLNIFTSVFHEVRHFEQKLIIEDENIPSSKLNLALSRDLYLYEQLGKTFYNKNYSFYSMENDAFLKSMQRYTKIMGYDEYFSNEENVYNSRLNNGRYNLPIEYHSYFYPVYIEGNKNDLSCNIMDIIIDKYEDFDFIMDEYPIFKKIYNKNDDGSYSPKSAVQLTKQLWKEINSINDDSNLSEEKKAELIEDSKEMYYELIYNALDNSTTDLLSTHTDLSVFDDMANAMGKNVFVKFLAYMKEYFSNQMSTCKQQLEEEYYSIMKLYDEFNSIKFFNSKFKTKKDFANYYKGSTEYYNYKIKFLDGVSKLYKDEPELVDDDLERC